MIYGNFKAKGDIKMKMCCPHCRMEIDTTNVEKWKKVIEKIRINIDKVIKQVCPGH